MLFSPKIFLNNMPFFRLLSFFLTFFASRRKTLIVITLLGVILTILVFSRLTIEEGIEMMLPDNESALVKDFELLQKTPFFHKIFINLSADEGVAPGALIETADQLARAMRPPFFKRVITGPQQNDGLNFLFWLLQNLPNLATKEDLAEIERRVDDEYIESAIRNNYFIMLSPKGLGLKQVIQIDPLNFRDILWRKFLSIKIVPEVRIQNNHFFSADGRNLLLVAETDTKITDLPGSEKLVAHFQKLVRNIVPSSIKVAMVSGHRYTVANAKVIKRDIAVALSFSFVALIVIFLIFLRCWQGVLVLLVPAIVLCFAGATLSLFYDKVSGLTIGFGAVLAGISIDYALHVFFAFRYESASSEKILSMIARPIFYGALTSIVAFATLLASNLPVLRQLSLFSIIGLAFSLLLSLIVLPHFIVKEQKIVFPILKRGNAKTISNGRLIFLGWILFFALCIWQASHLHFNGDLHLLNYVSDEIHRDEAQIKKIWGDMRDRAVIFASAPDMQSALELNDRIFVRLKKADSAIPMVSLAPFLPSIRTQTINQTRWHNFWTPQKQAVLREKIAKVSEKFGFSKKAFSRFYDLLEKAHPPITPNDFSKLSLRDLYDMLVVNQATEPLIMTLAPDTELVKKSVAAVQSQGLRLVSPSSFKRKLSGAMQKDFIRFLLLAFIMVISLLLCLFRDLRKVFLALIPVLTGLAAVCGGMGVLGLDFNLMNIISVPLIIGLGADYGIFMVCKLSDKTCLTVSRAVLVSGLTTIAGFGALAFAKHPALYSIGVTVLFGIGAAIPSALLVIPAFYRRQL